MNGREPVDPECAVLLAAGVGSRLGALGASTPKPLLPVAGRPVLGHHLERCARAGVRRVFVNTHHHAEQVQAYAATEGARLGLRVEFSRERELLGTAGALHGFRTALSGEPGEDAASPFLVIYADNFFAAEPDLAGLARAHRAAGRPLATVALHWREDVSTSGMVVLEPDGRRIARIIEKPAPAERVSHLVNAGIYVLEPRALGLVPPGASDFARDLFPRWLAGGEALGAFFFPGELLPIDTPELYERAAAFQAGALPVSPSSMDYFRDFFDKARAVCDGLDRDALARAVDVLAETRAGGGRLFFVGSGGGAGHASHATCDFRKIGGFEAYCPSDNVSELTARTNDEGWAAALADSLRASRFRAGDCLFVFSVGGGSETPPISANLVAAMKLAREVGARIIAVAGRDGGYAAQVADACILVPTLDPELITPLTEGFQAVVWHALVCHPKLKQGEMKWEGQARR